MRQTINEQLQGFVVKDKSNGATSVENISSSQEVNNLINNSYKFLTLDLRPNAVNEEFDIGIEVTDKRLIQDKINIDHHGEGTSANTPSSCEQALKVELPKEGVRFATIRADGDSVTAMAVLNSRLQKRKINTKIVEVIGILDRLGVQGLQNNEEYFNLKLETTSIMRIATDWKIPLEKRVEDIQRILEGNYPTFEMEKMISLKEKEFEDAKANSKVELKADGKIASVISNHRFATTLGYEMANIVIATNPEMLDPKTQERYNKHTVCRYNEFVEIDLEAIARELNSIESGWGGRGDIIGSPMGVSSKLSNEDVVKIVEKYIITEEQKIDQIFEGIENFKDVYVFNLSKEYAKGDTIKFGVRFDEDGDPWSYKSVGNSKYEEGKDNYYHIVEVIETTGIGWAGSAVTKAKSLGKIGNSEEIYAKALNAIKSKQNG